MATKILSQSHLNDLVLIAGANGKMGSTYLHNLSKRPHTKCIGLTKNPKKENRLIMELDVLNQKNIKNFIKKFYFEGYVRIYFIYSIGPFVFEEEGLPYKDDDGDGIDDDTYNLNYKGYKNIIDPLIKKIAKIPKEKRPLITLCAFGSISDRYKVPWWKSYSESKLILKDYMHNLVNEETRALFINVGSTEKEGERPLADKRYWLSCQEIYNASLRPLFDLNLYWQEIDIFKPSPYYYKKFFKDHEKLKKRWMHDMGK